ncbi:MAG: hypothetical protein GWP91_08270 [Rhodobacterales bacterium]|nr:hypothetical protein [Rhodobacterales bacterium]
MTTNKTPEIVDVQPEINDVQPEIIDVESDVSQETFASDKDSATDPEIEQIVEDFVEVGKMWAHHGVTIGKMAAKSSARTFEVTAGALETIARRFAPKMRRSKV